MGTTEPGLRERKKAKTRLLLQRKAEELFREKGFEATTVAEIAAAAEVSEPTFFRYYGSKVAVALVPLSDGLDLMVEMVVGRPVDEAPVQACLEVARTTDGSVIPPHATATLLRSLIGSQDVVSGILTAFDDARSRLALDFARRLGTEPNDPVALQTAGVVIAVVLGSIRAWSENPEVDPVATVVDGLHRLKAGIA